MKPRRRGAVYFADLGQAIGRKRVLVVSYEGVNRGMRQPICAVVTSRDRPRSVKTYVEIRPPEAGVSEVSFILCHHLQTFAESQIDQDPLGFVEATTMLKVHDALKIALDLP